MPRCLWQVGIVIYSFSPWYLAQRVHLGPEYSAIAWEVCNVKKCNHLLRQHSLVLCDLKEVTFARKNTSKFTRNIVLTVTGGVHYHKCVQTTKSDWAFVYIWTECFLTIQKTTFSSLALFRISTFVCLHKHSCPGAQQQTFTRGI